MKYFQLHMPRYKAFYIIGYLQQLCFTFFGTNMQVYTTACKLCQTHTEYIPYLEWQRLWQRDFHFNHIGFLHIYRLHGKGTLLKILQIRIVLFHFLY